MLECPRCQTIAEWLREKRAKANRHRLAAEATLKHTEKGTPDYLKCVVILSRARIIADVCWAALEQLKEV